jgi:hypothetical protein
MFNVIDAAAHAKRGYALDGSTAFLFISTQKLSISAGKPSSNQISRKEDKSIVCDTEIFEQ